MEHTINTITVRGTLQDFPRFSHENHGKRFFRLYLEVPRKSGAVDILPVIVEEQILGELDPTAGEMLTVTGQIRSYNHRSDGVRHLLIFIFASLVIAENGEPINDVVIQGSLCRQPTYRRTPLGREICDIMMVVPRAFHRADYLPCILWGRTAQEISLCQTGDAVYLEGRLQSRTYTKVTDDGPVQRVAYEISAMSARIMETEG